MVSAKKPAKNRAFAGDREVTAGEVAVGITQENREGIAASKSTSTTGMNLQRSHHFVTLIGHCQKSRTRICLHPMLRQNHNQAPQPLQ